MLESNVWGENSFLFIHTTWIGNDLLKIRKMNSAELILKTAYSSAIALAAILKTRSARRLARCLLPAFLCAHIFIKRETSGYEAVPARYFSLLQITLQFSPRNSEWTLNISRNTLLPEIFAIYLFRDFDEAHFTTLAKILYFESL